MGKDSHFTGQPVYSQVLKLLDKAKIRQISHDTQGSESYVKRFGGYEHLVVMLFGVLKHFDSLRELEIGMKAETHKLSHLGSSPNCVGIPHDIIIKAANSLSLWFPNHIGYERQLIISGLRSKGLLICSTEYKGNAIYLHLKTNSPKRCICPHCGGHHVIKYGIVKRTLHNLPFGSKPCYLSLQIQRYCCKDCGSVWQSEIPFTHGEVSYTYRFSRYVLDLLRMGNAIKDVSRHLRVGWNMVKDIHKKYLKFKYSRPDIRKVRRIGIDEFPTNKGHVYKTIVVDLDTGRIIHVGEGKG